MLLASFWFPLRDTFLKLQKFFRSARLVGFARLVFRGDASASSRSSIALWNFIFHILQFVAVMTFSSFWKNGLTKKLGLWSPFILIENSRLFAWAEWAFGLNVFFQFLKVYLPIVLQDWRRLWVSASMLGFWFAEADLEFSIRFKRWRLESAIPNASV